MPCVVQGQTLSRNPRPYLEGHADVVSRLMIRITRVILGPRNYRVFSPIY